MLKKSLISLIASAITMASLPCFAQQAAPDATKFIRVDRDTKNVLLQTAITTYLKDGVTVDLIGAIHIADASYYTQLNKEFKNYDALLFEMIGGGNMKKAKAKAAKKDINDPMLAMLGDIYGMVGKFLQLQGQKEGIDYTAQNFVHADLSMAEFQRLQQEKGESLLGFALKNAQNGEAAGAKQPDMQKLMMAFISGNSNAIKLELVDTLGGAGDQMAAMMGDSVIISDRNKACLKVLDTQIKAGKKKLGIFYGAAHFPDMEKDLLKRGYKKTAQRWLTAWDIPLVVAKPVQPADAAKPDQKKAPVALPDAA